MSGLDWTCSQQALCYSLHVHPLVVRIWGPDGIPVYLRFIRAKLLCFRLAFRLRLGLGFLGVHGLMSIVG